ncbi:MULTISPECIES: thioredoxin family protein [Desulfosediminicola]|uniref:thioredoxin family protein n=1 Tax=Desulfosediminicola TaxID=2886823 RepID=UPI0010ACE912|nr:thioredoxin family protein [Desulfosediminicola ganghwensis]
MKIQVFGPGCTKCQQVADNAKAAAEALGIEYEIEKISDFNVMMGFGVMMTPAIAIEGEVKVVGKVPTVDEIKTMLS